MGRRRVGFLQSRFDGAEAVFRVLDEKLAHITVAISCVSLEIDPGQDGHRNIAAILVETAGIAKQAQRILSSLAPRAPPPHNQEYSVRNRGKQPRLDSTERRRAVNDHTIVTLAQLTDEARH